MTTQTQVRSTEEALKLALEALCTCGPQQKQAIAAIKEALSTKCVAQPAVTESHKQEPVVCIGYWNQKTGAYYKPDQISAAHQKLIEDGILRRCYTTSPPVAEPHKRTWVGLTDEEVNELVENTRCEDYYGLVEATEAKLKEKNTRNGGCL